MQYTILQEKWIDGGQIDERYSGMKVQTAISTVVPKWEFYLLLFTQPWNWKRIGKDMLQAKSLLNNWVKP